MQGCGFDTVGTGVGFSASSTYLFYITQVQSPGSHGLWILLGNKGTRLKACRMLGHPCDVDTQR